MNAAVAARRPFTQENTFEIFFSWKIVRIWRMTESARRLAGECVNCEAVIVRVTLRGGGDKVYRASCDISDHHLVIVLVEARRLF
jgi:hypothetical protein